MVHMLRRVIYIESLVLLLSLSLTFTISSMVNIVVTEHDRLSNFDMNCSVSHNVNLPVDKMQPMKYIITLTINFDFIFGEIKIIFNIESPTRDVSLHTYGLTILMSEVELRNAYGSNKSYTLLGYRYCSVSQILDLRFNHTMIGVYNLTMKFLVPYSSQKGIVKYQYNKNATFGEEIRLYTTQFKPDGARRVFPCWDEPEIKAVFDITVRYPKNYILFSSTPIMVYHNVEASDNLLYSAHLVNDFPIPTSYIWIVLLQNNLVNTEVTEKNIIWHRPDVEIVQHAKTQLFKYGNLMRYLTLRNITIWPKRDYILIPTNTFKEMGCLGVIINREKDFLYDERSDFPGKKLYITQITAYKLARELFVGVIYSSQWTEQWLGESLAKFYSYFMMDKGSVDPNLRNLNIVKTRQLAFHYDDNLRIKPILAHNVDDIDEIDEVLISPLYYDKGFVLLRMLEYVLTSDKFQAAIMKYFKTYYVVFTRMDKGCLKKFGVFSLRTKENKKDLSDPGCYSRNIENIGIHSSASVNDFWTVLQQSYNDGESQKDTIKEIMDTWLTERYPTLLVYHLNDINKRTVLISQLKDNRSESLEWKIPVIYVNVTKPNFSLYLLNVNGLNGSQDLLYTTARLREFVIVNTEQSGYYRVNYDNRTWLQIATYLYYMNYKMHVLNRAQLIDDAYYFMMRGYITSSTFWEITKYLGEETNFVAWYPMFNILSYIGSYWNFPEAVYLKNYMLDIMDDLLRHIGFTENNDEDDMKKTLRLLAAKWACKLGSEPCRYFANQKLHHYLDNLEEYKILPWWKDWIYCAGMMSADKNILEKWFKKYLDTKNPDALKYLFCSEDERMIIKYLNLLSTYMFVQEPVIAKEYSNIYYGIIKKHIRNDIVLRRILNRYFVEKAGLQGDTIDRDVLGAIIVNIFSDKKLNKIIELFKTTTIMEPFDIMTSEINILEQAQKQRIRKFKDVYYRL